MCREGKEGAQLTRAWGRKQRGVAANRVGARRAAARAKRDVRICTHTAACCPRRARARVCVCVCVCAPVHVRGACEGESDRHQSINHLNQSGRKRGSKRERVCVCALLCVCVLCVRGERKERERRGKLWKVQGWAPRLGGRPQKRERGGAGAACVCVWGGASCVPVSLLPLSLVVLRPAAVAGLQRQTHILHARPASPPLPPLSPYPPLAPRPTHYYHHHHHHHHHHPHPFICLLVHPSTNSKQPTVN